MQFEAASFTNAPLSQDLSKSIVATAALVPGQVIFAELATVASIGAPEPEAGQHDEHCDNTACEGCAAIEDEDALLDALNEDDLKQVSGYVAEHFDALMETCDPLSALVDVELRKNLFKLFHIYETTPDVLTKFLEATLTSEKNSAAYLDAAKALREAHALAIPAGLTDDQVAHLIGILDTQSIPLEDGAGLFLYVPRIKHCCEPNAHYTDAGNVLWVTAIKPIAAGETITVDFWDAYYMTASERSDAFTEAGDECNCGVCKGTSPDKARGFKCIVNGCKGIVHPTKDVFTCALCQDTWNEATIAAAESEEIALTSDVNTDNIEQLQQILKDSKLHPFHHLLFSIMQILTEESMANISDEHIIALLERQIEAFHYVVPAPHSEKVSLYDSLAQAYIATDNIAKATESYTNAYNVSAIVFGNESNNTALFKKLMENTPRNAQEIFAAYGLDDEDEDDE